MSFLEVRHVQKIYTTRFGGTKVQALTDVNFTVEKGEYVAIMGESGSGKTTLLNILAALDKPTGGEVVLDGRPLSAIPEREIAAFRRSQLGFVFQEFNLLDTFSVQDNIFLPLALAGRPYTEMAARLAPIARQLGIAQLLQLVLADEPTGALDSRATDELLHLFEDINRGGQTILMVTHSVKAASHASRVLFIKDGEVFHEIYRGESTDEQLYQKVADTLTMLATGGEHHA